MGKVNNRNNLKDRKENKAIERNDDILNESEVGKHFLNSRITFFYLVTMHVLRIMLHVQEVVTHFI